MRARRNSSRMPKSSEEGPLPQAFSANGVSVCLVYIKLP